MHSACAPWCVPTRVVLHEVAHRFGISDERLVELDRY